MLLTILAACTIATADPQEGSPSDGQEAHRLLAKMKASRDRLKSGSFRASGRLLKTGEDMGPMRLQVEVEVFSGTPVVDYRTRRPKRLGGVKVEHRPE